MAKKTRVRIPGGQIITVSHPENASPQEILAFAQQQVSPSRQVPSIGPAREGPSDTVRGEQELMQRVQDRFAESEFAYKDQIPFAQRLQHSQLVTPEQGRNALPLALGTAMSVIPGGIIPSALMFGAGAGGGEALKPAFGGAPVSLQQIGSTAGAGARDSLIGGAIFRALQPLGRALVGRAATPEGESAMEFARRRSGEMADEMHAATPIGQAVPTAAADAMERGAPRLPLDSITDGSLLSSARVLLAGELPSNGRAVQAAQFINRELASFTGQVPKTSSIVQDAKDLVFADDSLKALRQFNHLDGDKWIDEVVTSANATALNQLARSSPEVHRQILAKNLENAFNSVSRSAPDLGMGLKAVDGSALRSWYRSNSKDITRVYGPGVAQKLDDFTNYAQFLDGIVTQAERGVGGSLGKFGTILRTAAEGGGMGILPKVVLPLQASAWVLGNTLMNPSSASFRFFSALPKAGRAIRTGAQAGSFSTDPTEMFLD